MSPRLVITGLAIAPDGKTVLVSEFSRGGVWRSTDAGMSWEALGLDGLLSTRVWSVAIDPARPGRVLAAAAAGGLHLLQSPTQAPEGQALSGAASSSDAGS